MSAIEQKRKLSLVPNADNPANVKGASVKSKTAFSILERDILLEVQRILRERFGKRSLEDGPDELSPLLMVAVCVCVNNFKDMDIGVDQVANTWKKYQLQLKENPPQPPIAA